MRGGALTQDQCRWLGPRLTLRVHVTLADDLEDALRSLQQHVTDGLEFAGIVGRRSGCRQLSTLVPLKEMQTTIITGSPSQQPL